MDEKKNKKSVVKKPHKQAPTKPKKVEELAEGIKGIVRLAGKDINGGVKLKRAILKIRGIGTSLAGPVANIIANELNVSPDIKVGEFSDEQIEKVDKILFNIHNLGLPKFLLNRRKDITEGTDRHVIMSDLIFSNRQDVEREKKLYTWKGYRHTYGQKVRGQRTRNTGRTGMAVGVLRKTVLAAQKAAAAPAAGAPAAKEGAPAKK